MFKNFKASSVEDAIALANKWLKDYDSMGTTVNIISFKVLDNDQEVNLVLHYQTKAGRF